MQPESAILTPEVAPVRPPKLRRDWIGKKARLRRDVGNRGGVNAQAGSIVTVVRIYRGAEIEMPRCECCKVKYTVSRVDWWDLEYIG